MGLYEAACEEVNQLRQEIIWFDGKIKGMKHSDVKKQLLNEDFRISTFL